MSKVESDIEEWIYRHYVANSLNGIIQRKYIPKSLYDYLHPQAESTETGEEIVERITKGAGLIWSK